MCKIKNITREKKKNKVKNIERDYCKIYMKDIVYNNYYKDREYWYNIMLDHYDDKKWVNTHKYRIYVNKESSDYKTVSISVFNQNIVLWEMFKLFTPEQFDSVITTDHIINKSLNDNDIADYINIQIRLFDPKEFDVEELNFYISEETENLAFISEDFAKYKGFSMDLWGLTEVFIDSESFKELYNKTIDPNMQACEIEKSNNRDIHRMVNILKQYDTSFTPMIRAGKLTKPKQLCELLLNAGLRPDIDGKTFPYPMQSNFLRGLDTVPDLFQDASGAIKAAVMGKRNTGNSGHFASQVALVTIGRTLTDDQMRVCDTLHSLSGIEIRTHNHLKKYNKRYYFLDDPDDVRVIDSSVDTHLIGTSINLFSPLTCSDDQICYRCYGELAYVNLARHVGVLASLTETEPLTQLMLSAKHLLQTISMMLDFPEVLSNYVDIHSNMITSFNNKNKVKGVNLIIYEDDMILENENDDPNKLYNRYVNKFTIDDNGKHIEISESSGIDMYPTEELSKFLSNRNMYENEDKTSYYKIPMSKLCGTVSKDPISLFSMEILNTELTKPYNEFKSLLNNKHSGCTTMTEMVNAMTNILVDCNLPSMSIHSEVIISCLIRDKHDILKRPDFTQDDIEYVILGLESAIMNNPSVEVSLAFQKIKQQIFNSPTTYKKEKSSVIISGINK